jgi:molybdopterin synthase sulfur carrier subunit
MGQPDGVAQRHQFTGLLRAHDGRHPRDAEHIPLLVAAIGDQRQCGRLHADPAFGDRHAVGLGLGTDIDHMDIALPVEVGKFTHVIDAKRCALYNETMITIRYFASLREQLGKAQEQIEPATGMTALDAWKSANAGTFPPDNVLVAINQSYASLDSPIASGDEVAFFPPVTGG